MIAISLKFIMLLISSALLCTSRTEYLISDYSEGQNKDFGETAANSGYRHTRATTFFTKLQINRNIFGVSPHSSIIPNQYDSMAYKHHERYIVKNIGRVNVTARTKYGMSFMWISYISEYTIQPGKTQILENFGKRFFRTAVQIENKEDSRAIVYVSGGNRIFDNSPPMQNDEYKDLKRTFELGVKMVPHVRSGLEGLIDAFWPHNRSSVWEELYSYNMLLLGDRNENATDGIKNFEKRILNLGEMLRSGSDQNLNLTYIKIAGELRDYEQKFNFTESNSGSKMMNFNSLPLFTNLITMKMYFYALGLYKPEMFKLDENDIKIIKQYAQNSLYGSPLNAGAISYIQNMYIDIVNDKYEHAYAGALYNEMMNVRSYIALHGLEMIPVWELLYNNPASEEHPYIDVISYSKFFGRATADLFQQATPTQMLAPLTPSLTTDKKRLKLASIDCYILRILKHTPPRIGGLKLTFEDSSNYTLGTITTEGNKLDLQDRYIVNLRAYGKGALDRLIFTMSDGKIFNCGSAQNTFSTIFRMDDHHIVSLYLTSNATGLGGQAVNIAVSFQRNEI